MAENVVKGRSACIACIQRGTEKSTDEQIDDLEDGHSYGSVGEQTARYIDKRMSGHAKTLTRTQMRYL